MRVARGAPRGLRDAPRRAHRARRDAVRVGGARGDQVYLWDIEAVARPAASAPRDDAALVRAMEGQTDSAYALAMDATGTTIVSGCSAGTVRVWDARDSSAPVKLRGHTGNARCAAMDPTGRLCITGSSDGTIRLWDVGQRRCVQTMGNVHRRGVGVWSVAMDESWHAAYSGGADGRVHVTDVARRRTAPLFQEPAGVIDLRLADDGASVWAATMSSRVRRWSTRTSRDAGGAKEKARRRVAEPGAWFSVKAEQNESATEADHLAETAKPQNRRVTVAKPDPHPPTHAEPLATIAGAPPIVEHAQLTDRTRVLAKDAEGGVSLWDVTRFEQTKAWPPGTDFAATREAESPKVSIPAWFQVDSRSGSLAVTLAPYSAFQAEAYAADMGLEGANDETKINVGAQTVHALLRKWAAARRAAAANAGDVGEDVGAVDGGVAKRDVNALRASEDAGAYPSARAADFDVRIAVGERVHGVDADGVFAGDGGGGGGASGLDRGDGGWDVSSAGRAQGVLLPQPRAGPRSPRAEPGKGDGAARARDSEGLRVRHLQAQPRHVAGRRAGPTRGNFVQRRGVGPEDEPRHGERIRVEERRRRAAPVQAARGGEDEGGGTRAEERVASR